MLHNRVTAKGHCIYCGSKLTQCPVCQEWFLVKNKNHIYCRARCRMRKHRELKLRKIMFPEGENDAPITEEQTNCGAGSRCPDE